MIEIGDRFRSKPSGLIECVVIDITGDEYHVEVIAPISTFTRIFNKDELLQNWTSLSYNINVGEILTSIKTGRQMYVADVVKVKQDIMYIMRDVNTKLSFVMTPTDICKKYTNRVWN